MMTPFQTQLVADVFKLNFHIIKFLLDIEKHPCAYWVQFLSFDQLQIAVRTEEFPSIYILSNLTILVDQVETR